MATDDSSNDSCWPPQHVKPFIDTYAKELLLLLKKKGAKLNAVEKITANPPKSIQSKVSFHSSKSAASLYPESVNEARTIFERAMTDNTKTLQMAILQQANIEVKTIETKIEQLFEKTKQTITLFFRDLFTAMYPSLNFDDYLASTQEQRTQAAPKLIQQYLAAFKSLSSKRNELIESFLAEQSRKKILKLQRQQQVHDAIMEEQEIPMDIKVQELVRRETSKKLATMRNEINELKARLKESASLKKPQTGKNKNTKGTQQMKEQKSKGGEKVVERLKDTSSKKRKNVQKANKQKVNSQKK